MKEAEQSFKHLSFLRLRKSRSIFELQKLTSCAERGTTGGGTDLQTRNCRQFLLIREQLRSRSWPAAQLCKLWQRATKSCTNRQDTGPGTNHWGCPGHCQQCKFFQMDQLDQPTDPGAVFRCLWGTRELFLIVVVYNCTWWPDVQLLRPTLCYTRYRARAARDWQ